MKKLNTMGTNINNPRHDFAAVLTRLCTVKGSNRCTGEYQLPVSRLFGTPLQGEKIPETELPSARCTGTKGNAASRLLRMEGRGPTLRKFSQRVFCKCSVELSMFSAKGVGFSLSASLKRSVHPWHVCVRPGTPITTGSQD